MKKILAIVLSVVMAAVLALPAFAADIPSYFHVVDTGDKTDVLNGLSCTFARSKYTGATDINTAVDNKTLALTDGIFAMDLKDSAGAALDGKYGEYGKTYSADLSGSYVHVNTAWANANNTTYPNNVETLTGYEAGKGFTVGTGALIAFGGVATKYYYSYQFDGLANVTVGSFALYFTNAGQNNFNSTATATVDCAYDILVSTDGGNTWSVAWKSVDLVYGADGKVSSSAAMTVEQGGNVVLHNDNELYQYMTVTGDFDKVYKNVTNVAYACRAPRVSSNAPFYYVARISEFDVYTAVETAAGTEAATGSSSGSGQSGTTSPATGDGYAAVIWLFAGAAAIAVGSAVVLRRKKEN
jgi:LPXTG-motif cell wall-anchored protein